MERRRVIFATNNQGKMKEIRTILQDTHLPIYSLKDLWIDIDIVEDGETYTDNALIKARAIHALFPDDIILADDSGIEIDYLNKEPGVQSARFGGVDTPYAIKNQMFLDQLIGVSGDERSARFVCVIAAVFPDGSEETCMATMEGQIATEAKGENGFGYDPIFYVPEYQCTSAEMTEELKNELSHRGKALRKMSHVILERIEDRY